MIMLFFVRPSYPTGGVICWRKAVCGAWEHGGGQPRSLGPRKSQAKGMPRLTTVMLSVATLELYYCVVLRSISPCIDDNS